MPQVPRPTRRQWLTRIGQAAGAGAMYTAMTQLGLAAGSAEQAPPALSPAPKGSTVLVLGAGLAGLNAALELHRAGYRVKVLEYNQRPGGRCWSLRGGDRYTELGGATQLCGFDAGQYFNPGPWRIPYHHHAVLGLCKRLGVALEPFVQVNHNAYLHAQDAFGGKPQRFRELQADFQGAISELLAKVTQQHQLDAQVTSEDQALLLEALRANGALDRQFRYTVGEAASEHRGPAREAGAGLAGRPEPSQPVGLHELLQSRLWSRLNSGSNYEMQSPMFQPVGGMDAIAKALARQLPAGMVRYRARVTAVHQGERGVTVRYVDEAQGGRLQQAQAQWCVCTIPLSILGQLDVQAGPAMREAIAAVAYASAVKVGLQFKRRFWEEDEAIYGGISYTDLPLRLIGYPSHGTHGRKGVLLGAYSLFVANAYEFSALAPAERVRQAVALGAQIHPQYPQEFETGMAVAWHRSPFTLGCFAAWGDEARQRHYDNLCAMDQRLVLAGEHASYLPAWQEGAILSAQDAVRQLHRRALAG
nr:NAD(P)/FAD-dependent oxidoreductase [uncultured Roseateles sp.]